MALPAGTEDAGWLRAVDAVALPLLRAFQPTVLVSQHGCDSHRLDPLAHLALTVDGQRQAQLMMHELAHELCEGRWIATGGGGYGRPGGTEDLDAPARGRRRDADRPGNGDSGPVAGTCPSVTGETPPGMMTDGAPPRYVPFAAGIDPGDPVDRAIMRTRTAVFPSHGLSAV